jgi:prepilin-type N-terminal cleavage/methylation domain-containing protein
MMGGATMSRNQGFTLLELTVSMALLVVVSVLTFVVTNSSTSAAGVAEAKEQAQAAVRDAMNATVAELQLASKTDNPALVPPLSALVVAPEDPGEVTFQIPLNNTGTQWSAPITFRFINEDDHEGPGASNGRLDEGEDADGDHALTRRIVRVQGGNEVPVGAVNDLTSVIFTMNPPQNNILTITLTASKPLPGRDDQVWATATSRVYLLN